MGELISFNSDNFLMAKAYATDPYAKGPIQITDQPGFWVLASVIPQWNDESVIAKDVRISFKKVDCSDRETVIECNFSCPDASPKKYHSEISFVADRPFYLEVDMNSALMYSPLDGWMGDKGKRLLSNAFEDAGAPIGYEFPDGEMRGGAGNHVTVSIWMRVIFYEDGQVTKI